MAYFVKILMNCQGKGGRCPRIATHEVYERKDLIGRFCEPCAEQLVNLLNEDKERRRGRTNRPA